MHELLNYPSETDLEEYPEEKIDWAGSILDDDYSTLPQPTWEDGYTKRVSLNACNLFYSKNRIRLVSTQEAQSTIVESSLVEIPTPDLPFGILGTDTFEEVVLKLKSNNVGALETSVPHKGLPFIKGEVVLDDGVVTYKTPTEDIALGEPVGLTLDFSKLDLEDTGESDLDNLQYPQFYVPGKPSGVQ